MSLVKNVGTIGGLTMVSRIAGFARDMLLARILGPGMAADSFFVALDVSPGTVEAGKDRERHASDTDRNGEEPVVIGAGEIER